MLPLGRESENRVGGVWVLLAGFAVAALLTLGAAVGTSVLHREADAKDSAAAPPVAQR
jgi:hypothetical protein